MNADDRYENRYQFGIEEWDGYHNSRRGVDVCNDCGSLVVDREAHDKFHDQFDVKKFLSALTGKQAP